MEYKYLFNNLACDDGEKLIVTNENKLTKEQFSKISEDAVLFAYKKQLEEYEDSFVHSPWMEYIKEYFLFKGFKEYDDTFEQTHHFSVDSKDMIKNKDLKRWMDREIYG